MSLSRTQFPPGGWEFYQPSTGWHAPTPISSTFDQTVQLIIKHRLQNPALTAQHKLSTDPAAVGMELEQFTAVRLGIPLDNSPKMLPPRTLPQAVVGAVAAVSRMADGVALLMDWLPQGQTVAPELAVKRAGICTECKPFNDPKALGSWFTQPISEKLKKMIEARQDLKLETPHDPALGVCSICLCPLKLKVHVPMQHIVEHTKAQTMTEFPNWCWIKTQDQ